jgi:hypothetical protein
MEAIDLNIKQYTKQLITAMVECSRIQNRKYRPTHIFGPRLDSSEISKPAFQFSWAVH